MRKHGTLALPSTMGVSIQASHRSLGWERIGPGTNNNFNMDHFAGLARSVRGSGGPPSHLGLVRGHVFPLVPH